jgi:hypothetical protein
MPMAPTALIAVPLITAPIITTIITVPISSS